ncbi:aggregation-promoting factor C-terminal-like domain-containing protein [Streptomyces sp. NPDC001617]
MNPISVRGFAVASATAVTAVGSVVGVASGTSAQTNDAEATNLDSTLLADIPAGEQARVQTASLTQQADVQAVQADASARKDAEEAARRAAARTAVAKKEAARKAKEAKETKETASRDTPVTPVLATYTTAQIKALAAQMVPSGQFQCFSNIVEHESGWNMNAMNASSGAYGLFQALPASKYSSAGSDWQTNPATQIKWGLNYMNVRYGSPCDAWAFWQTHHSY